MKKARQRSNKEGWLALCEKIEEPQDLSSLPPSDWRDALERQNTIARFIAQCLFRYFQGLPMYEEIPLEGASMKALEVNMEYLLGLYQAINAHWGALVSAADWCSYPLPSTPGLTLVEIYLDSRSREVRSHSAKQSRSYLRKASFNKQNYFSELEWFVISTLKKSRDSRTRRSLKELEGKWDRMIGFLLSEFHESKGRTGFYFKGTTKHVRA